MTKFFNKFKKPLLALFWSIFPILGQKKFFLVSLALSRTTSYGFLAPWQNLEKTNDKFQENARKKEERRRKTEGRMEDGRKDGQTLFYRTLPANARGPNMIKHFKFLVYNK